MSRRDAIGAGVRSPEADPMAAIYGPAALPAAARPARSPAGEEAAPPAVALSPLSMRIDGELLERARDLAYWDRLSLVAVVEQALRASIVRYEEAHGPLSSRPRSARRLRRRAGER
jgi:hypothetical protein